MGTLFFEYERNEVLRMLENDTVKLLRECDAGIQMGLEAIDKVIPYTSDEEFKGILENNKHEHEKLEDELLILLEKYHDSGKEPNPMAKGMSWVKTNMKMAMDSSDATIAGLMTDGCNMGVKSLNKYLNKYEAADEKSKDIANRLIHLEQKLTEDIRDFL